MAIKEQERQILIEKRARALTMMLLTHRADLLIEEVNDDIGLDYIVRFRTAGKEGLREFGIEQKAAQSAETRDQANKLLRTALEQVKHYGPFLRPVCLFLFAMENDVGWYTWVAEPIEENEKPLLRSCAEPDCRHLDRKALKEIIDRVDLWYDAMFASLVVNGSGGGKAERKGAKE